MNDPRVHFTLIAGRELREELLDFLSEQTELVPGFTVLESTGHSPTVRLPSMAEQVKGRADRVMVQMVLPEAAATALIARLEKGFAGAHLNYWITPLLYSGIIE